MSPSAGQDVSLPGLFADTVDVRIVNVKVVVTDRKGSRIPGLKPDDFEFVLAGQRRTVATPDARQAMAHDSPQWAKACSECAPDLRHRWFFGCVRARLPPARCKISGQPQGDVAQPVVFGAGEFKKRHR